MSDDRALSPRQGSPEDLDHALKALDEGVMQRRPVDERARQRIKRAVLATHEREARSAMAVTPRRAMTGALALALLALLVSWGLSLARGGQDGPAQVASRQEDDPTSRQASDQEPAQPWDDGEQPGCASQPLEPGQRWALAAGCARGWPEASASLRALDDSELSVEGGAWRVRRGRVRVEVDPKRRRQEPVRVLVSGGVIEVLGTVFTIEERGDAGQVTLHRGTIQLLDASGRRTRLSAGQTLRWGEQASDEPAPQAELEEPKTPPTHKPEASSATPAKPGRPAPEALDPGALEQVARLRRERDFEGALSSLRALGARRLDARSAEIISYEIGDILTHERGDRPAACAHWQRHLRRHGDGVMARAARQAKAQVCGRP